MEDWGLQAVVNESKIFNEAIADVSEMQQPLLEQHESLMSLGAPEVLTNGYVGLDELGELYKPFYPISQQTIVTASFRAPGEARDSQGSVVSRGLYDHLGDTSVQGNKLRKSRKSEQKREVKLLTADGLLSDTWAWRKYGQKPIKGSPYPRSYYRCSTSKACLARKQVERSPLNPEAFIVTYDNEHSHGRPTRRSSLAGLYRNKPARPKLVAAESLNQSPGSLASPSLALPQGKLAEQEGFAPMARDHSQGGHSEDLWLNTVSSCETMFPCFGNMDEMVMSSDFCFDGCFEIR